MHWTYECCEGVIFDEKVQKSITGKDDATVEAKTHDSRLMPNGPWSSVVSDNTSVCIRDCGVLSRHLPWPTSICKHFTRYRYHVLSKNLSKRFTSFIPISLRIDDIYY